FWAGNWVLGRALRDVFEPAALNFWRWLIALVALAPFALPGVRANIAAIRRSAGLLLALSFLGVALFQWLIYEGLKTTTAVNAVLLNSSFPAFMLLCSWAIERERGTRRQIVRSEEHTSELQSRFDLVCRLLLEKKKNETTSQSARPLHDIPDLQVSY